MNLLFAGSFDPLTFGHTDIITKAIGIGDLHIVIANNSDKQYMYSSELRKSIIDSIYISFPEITVAIHDGLIADYAKENEIDCFVRGIRNYIDLEYEYKLAEINKHLCNIDTLFIMADEKFKHISSSLVKTLIKHNKPIHEYVPVTDCLKGD